MQQRFVLFLVLSFAVLFGWTYFFGPKPAPRPQGAQREAAKEQNEPGQKPGDGPDKGPGVAPEQPGPEVAPADQSQPPQQPAAQQQPREEFPRRWITLGSADPNSPYRMLVTLTSKGAALARAELNSPRYMELDRSGYIGYVAVDESILPRNQRDKGALVQIIGPGTPAEKAGLKVGDRIVAVDKQIVTNAEILHKVLEQTKPNRLVTLRVEREGEKEALSLPVTLRRRPLQIIRPEGQDSNGSSQPLAAIRSENDDPLSMLLTLHQLGEDALDDDSKDMIDVGEELEGVDLWNSDWEVVAANEDQAKFRQFVWRDGRKVLEIVKTYRLAPVPDKSNRDPNFPAYHLYFNLEIHNIGAETLKVAYQLDGPNGLPTEGEWYANKISRSWGSAGLRDVVVSFDGQTPSMINCPKIAKNDDLEKPWQDEPITFIGVDAQYFSSVVVPQREDPKEIWFAQSHPLRVGPEMKDTRLTNTSVRMISNVHELAPGDRSFSREFMIFAGPKKPNLLAQSPYSDHGMGELVYYGWFGVLARPMSKILHGLHFIVMNYGLAIILLTIVVRGLMFPISRKQALNAQKMQELQPEIKKIQEKYKKDLEARTKAQQELFRKHNYNPLSGCLVLFFQLPVFIALYRSLMVDIELRQAPLISESIRWCSNLAAPDMLLYWEPFMPGFVTGMLGPYLNLLPLLTIVLFIAQQKMFMPPPADEQQAMQQKMMKYMMVFIGFLFFKVASGLCIYFIASSLWGLAERKFLPKHQPAAAASTAPARESRPAKADRPARQDRDGAARKKAKSKRGKR